MGVDAAPALQRVAASPDLLALIMCWVPLIIPDDASSLFLALQRAASGQRLLLRCGEHSVSGRLRIDRHVFLSGEEGACIRGTLVLGAEGGEISDLTVDDGGDCCLRCEGGDWTLRDLRLRCCHSAALHVSGSARVVLCGCTLGGDEDHGTAVMLSAYGSVQQTGMRKRACYGVVVKDRAACRVRECALTCISEAAVLLLARSQAVLEKCVMSEGVTCGFDSGRGRGRLLEVRGCALELEKLWGDMDRPRQVVWEDDNK
eukprot:gene22706-27408_t